MQLPKGIFMSKEQSSPWRTSLSDPQTTVIQFRVTFVLPVQCGRRGQRHIYLCINFLFFFFHLYVYLFVCLTHLNGIVLDIEVTSSSSKVCRIQVPCPLFKANHLCFIQMACSICNQIFPVFMEKGVLL